MAATAVSLHLRPKRTQIANPTFLHFHFSSSSTPSDSPDHNEQNTAPPPPPQQSPFSSYFSDVKANLKQTTPPPPSHSVRGPKTQSFDEIRKRLSQFHRPSSAPAPHDKNSSPTTSTTISFQELYRRRSESSTIHATNKDGSRKPSFEAICESLHQLKGKNDTNNQNRDPMSLKKLTSDLNLRPVGPNTVIGGTDEKLPASVFQTEVVEEKKEQEQEERASPAMRTEFLRNYSYVELGERLRKLRPEGKRGAGDGFSLGELNERLVKLREAEKKETEEMMSGISFRDLRQSLMAITVSGKEKNKKQTFQRLTVMGQLGETPNFMLSPPKDHLVEKYFHPDNMSSSEKMKLELQKVRDEFKMSESDCGSARVQVAQLTTKIKHLSTALDKKDKHSRKGLQAMVQRRKKLLKYLRRTDWDSYCMVLSRLGLRDNPDFKILTYPKKTA